LGPNSGAGAVCGLAWIPAWALPTSTPTWGEKTYAGFEWEILEAIAQTLEVRLEPVYIPWSQQLTALQADEVDLIWGAREGLGLDSQQFLATRPYYLSPQRLVVRDPGQGEPPIQSLAQLFGRKVGIVVNSTGAALLEAYNERRGNPIRLFATSNPERLFAQLQAGQLDAVLVDQPVAVLGLRQAGSRLRLVGPPLFPIPLVGVVSSQHPSLKEAVDAAIAALAENGNSAANLGEVATMGANADVPRIDRGLARYETDHFAILGVPLTADPKRIRRGYLQAAKALHPDRFVGDPEGAERANVLFAKLVNPANEVLTKERERSEYEALLKLRIQRLLESPPADLWPTGEAVKGLAESPNWEEEYVQRVEKLAKEQYSSLATLLEKTEQLSELNLAYLLLKAGYKASPAPAPKTTPLGGIPTSPPSSAAPFSCRPASTSPTQSCRDPLPAGAGHDRAQAVPGCHPVLKLCHQRPAQRGPLLSAPGYCPPEAGQRRYGQG
jgi:ABC-type amino acid transport substrate-binding protein